MWVICLAGEVTALALDEGICIAVTVNNKNMLQVGLHGALRAGRLCSAILYTTMPVLYFVSLLTISARGVLR